VHAIHEPQAPSDWSRYARDWLQARELDAEVLVFTQEQPAHSDGRYAMEIVDLK